MPDSADRALEDPDVQAAIARRIMAIEGARITYNLAGRRIYDWNDPEEWARARTIARLVVNKVFGVSDSWTE